MSNEPRWRKVVATSQRCAAWLRFLIGSVQVVHAVRHWHGHMNLARVLAQPSLAEFANRRPRVLFKYLHRAYLARRLSRERRLAILTHHYSYVARMLPRHLVRKLLRNPIPVWQRHATSGEHSIVLSFPRHDLEGELLLEFLAGQAPIYAITMTLADGGLERADGIPTLLITCVQGAVGRLGLIRQATRDCAHTPPVYLLLAAAQGLAATLRVGRILGVGNDRQLARSRPGDTAVSFDYDLFWSRLGGTPTDDGCYLFPPRFPEKPLHAFPSGQQHRKRAKRLLKREVAEAVAHRLQVPEPHAVPPVFE